MDKTIFGTEVFLEAIEVEINGRRQWRWVATSFEGETFQNGRSIDVYTYADTFDGLKVPH